MIKIHREILSQYSLPYFMHPYNGNQFAIPLFDVDPDFATEKIEEDIEALCRELDDLHTEFTIFAIVRYRDDVAEMGVVGLWPET